MVELKRLAAQHPELAGAVAMQLELVEVIRRVQGRIPTPPQLPREIAARRLGAGGRLLEFGEFPLEWSDFRFVFRQVADILRRFEALEPGDHEHLQMLVRDGNRIERVIQGYYERTARPERFGGGTNPTPSDQPALLEQVAALSLRPFLARSAEVWSLRVDLAAWQRPYCPICGAEPDLAVLSTAGDRLLVCGRCLAQWPFDPTACPFCDNVSSERISSFASRDRRYRVYGCDVCRKYLKAYDTRGADRPVMPSVDSIATLPLDAAAIQKGYDG